jgi:regulator of replication initiation timing
MTREQIQERQAELRQQVVLLKDDVVWDEEKVDILKEVSRLRYENKNLREKLYILTKEVESQKNALENLHTEAAIRV